MLKGNAMNRPVACLFVALALSSAAAAKDLVGVYEDATEKRPADSPGGRQPAGVA